MKHRKPPGHASDIDRHGATWQKARLYARRMRQRYDESAESGDASAIAEASRRLRAAEQWEIRSAHRYVQAVMATYDRPIPAGVLALALAGRAA